MTQAAVSAFGADGGNVINLNGISSTNPVPNSLSTRLPRPP
jgi:hypothetical protein